MDPSAELKTKELNFHQFVDLVKADVDPEFARYDPMNCWEITSMMCGAMSFNPEFVNLHLSRTKLEGLKSK